MTTPEGDPTPFGADRRKLQTKVRRLHLGHIQSIKGLQPISESAAMIGKKRFLEVIYLAVLNRDPAATAWWKVYDGLPVYEQRISHVNFDEVAIAAGVRPDDLLKGIVGAAILHGSRTNELVFAVTHPRVIKNMAISASRISTKLDPKILEIGHKDRVAFLQGSGTLKMRQGPSIHVSAKSDAASASAAKAEVASADASVPSFLSDVGSLDASKAAVQKSLTGVVDGEAE